MAEKFKFRLDKLLEIRMQKEEECKREFNENQRQKKIIESKLQDLNEKKNAKGNLMKIKGRKKL